MKSLLQLILILILAAEISPSVTTSDGDQTPKNEAIDSANPPKLLENSERELTTNKILKLKAKANKKYQKLLKVSLASFRKQQERVHQLFEKSFKKKIKAVEKENKDLLALTLSNYATILDEDDKKIREVINKNLKIAHKAKNRFVNKYLDNDLDSPPRTDREDLKQKQDEGYKK